ncbi:MAG: type II secretion system protein [Candidatus Kaiserbacteria bacterium]|nr:MAG: type II secretion system protein [Candidatus Kaiserbacteria bacterium]
MVHADVRRPPSAHALLGRDHESGFTLIELIVVTAILTLISSLILVSNNRFGGRILLENLAYDVALSIREAQVFGISVRQFGAGNFGAGYGVQFTRVEEGGEPSTTFVLFADAVSANGIYDQGEIVGSPYLMERGFHVADLCARGSGAEAETCGLSRLDMLFKRPEPDAYIRINGNLGSLQERGRIVLESPRGDRVSVVVEITGQISVE